MSRYANVEWEDIKDRIGGGESGGMGYDTVVYDVPDSKGGRRNAAGIKPPKPISQMTIGELNDWQESQRELSKAYGARRFGPSDVRATRGSTGAGKYQFERSTLKATAEREFGPEWRNQRYSPENQERLAKRLWNDVRGNEALARNTWANVKDLDGDGRPAGQYYASNKTNNTDKEESPEEMMKREYKRTSDLMAGFMNKRLTPDAQKAYDKTAALMARFSSGLPMAEGIRFKHLRSKARAK